MNKINEALITIGGGRPKYDQVIILGGGTGVGKGFVLNNLLGIEGRVFDVDKLKSLGVRSKILNDKVLKMTGRNLTDLDFTNPEDVTFIHLVFNELGIADKEQFNLLKALSTDNNKPNLIFDVTLSDLSKLIYLGNTLTKYGYKKENIHIVWVMNDIDVAWKQNTSRERVVDRDIFKVIHNNVVSSLNFILSGGFDVKNYMDGDFWLVFNQRFVDTTVTSSNNGGKYVSKASYVKIKEKNGNLKKVNEISQEIMTKINEYLFFKFD